MNDVENEVVDAALSEKESFDSNNDHPLDSGAAVFSSNVNTETEEEDDEQIFWGKDGSCWQALAPSEAASGRLH